MSKPKSVPQSKSIPKKDIQQSTTDQTEERAAKRAKILNEESELKKKGVKRKIETSSKPPEKKRAIENISSDSMDIASQYTQLDSSKMSLVDEMRFHLFPFHLPFLVFPPLWPIMKK